ncbi:bacterial Ig-like domain-containing protein [Lactococcus lactis]|uniref:bacterial Ig-like domain-containing protein n=1 Tax=Lactococcus lactis TaxID=1358 RepID=UPI002657FE6E|nr:bacterial Ig-like domain-containing protein [Lactococcus lactis]WKF72376.1 bacterial Ig-like domain-containing protein [Lactococcus lactis]
MSKIKTKIALGTIILGALTPNINSYADTLIQNTQPTNSMSTIDNETIDSWMPDKQLQSVVSKNLGISIENLTKNDLLKLTDLRYATRLGISSLKGLEYATNLEGDIDLNFNSISDISPLYSTKIKYLRLSDNEISDVSQFLKMKNLSTLVVPNNHIRDLSSLIGSQYTRIIADGQTVTLPTQQVFPKQLISVQSGVLTSLGQKVQTFTKASAYDQSSDTISWQLDGTSPSNVYADWYSDGGDFTGELIQPLTYKPEKASDITVKYVDSNNSEIHSPLTISGNVGESYDATTSTYKLDIKGYHLDTNQLPSNSTGTLSDKPQIITYIYIKDKPVILNVHDSNIYVGDTWNPKDNFDSALDKDGNSVDFSNLTVDASKVDTTKTGTYDVTYTYDGVTSTAKVTVKDKQTAVNVHDSNIYVGDTWNPKDNFDSALDKDGNSVDFSNLTVDASKVDTTKTGTYDVTYTYDGVTSTAKVTVRDKQTAVNVHDSNIYVGNTWNPKDNFDSALDKDGNSVDFSNLTVDASKVDTTKTGTYDVTYTYDGVTSTAKVTVKDKQTAVNVHDSNIYVGDTWNPKDNFDSALDKDGNSVDFSNLTVDASKVDTTKTGTYDVTYTYDGVTSTAKVTVRDKQTAVNVHDSNIYVGNTWNPKDNFDSALDKDGNSVDFSNLTVDASKVDTTKTGTYDVTYTYDGVTSTAKVTVKDKQTAVNVHDSNIYVGDTWNPKDNFDSALDKDGNSVDFSNLTVDASKVDTTKTGTYDVTYTYDGVTSTAKVTVRDKQTAVNVHDSNIYVGNTWNPKDNFDSALDKDGNSVDFSNLTADASKVDTTKAGTYDVTYTYDGVTSTAKVTVRDKLPISNDKKKLLNLNNLNKSSSNVDKNTNLPKTGEIDAFPIKTMGLGSVLVALLVLFRKNKPET